MSVYCPLHIIIGNHDIYNKSDNDVNSLKAYNYIPNVHVYEKPSVIKFDNRSILFMPWVENKDEQISILKEFTGCDYLFCHSDLNGAKMHLTSVSHKNQNKIDVEEFKGYKNVYSGHIHLVQKNKNFTFVGSIHEMDRNDIDNQKGIFLLDTESDKEEFIPNTISPKFRKIYLNEEEDIDKLDTISDDWIDLFISNSLLINNRKLRRKLETVLESGSFSSVEYIDDISTPEIEVVDTNPDNVTVSLDFEEYIKNYINTQNWDSDRIKNGILSEFEGIIEIYKDSNKKI